MGKPKYSEKNLSQCHFVYHKSNMGRSGIDVEPVIIWSVAQNICVLKEPDVVIVLRSEGLI